MGRLASLFDLPSLEIWGSTVRLHLNQVEKESFVLNIYSRAPVLFSKSLTCQRFFQMPPRNFLEIDYICNSAIALLFS